MKLNLKKSGITIFLVSLIGIIFISGCIQNPETKNQDPSPPIISSNPITIGYIQSYNHNLGYGYDYPENWTMRSGPEYFNMDGGILNVEQFVDEPEATTITVIVKTSIWKNLDEAKAAIRDAFDDEILNEKMKEVNGIKGYEITHQSLNFPVKFKIVIFYVDGRIYEFDYGAEENLYNASEEIFNHVVNSFNI